MYLSANKLKYILCLSFTILLYVPSICLACENCSTHGQTEHKFAKTDSKFEQNIPKLIKLLKSDDKKRVLQGLNIVRTLGHRLQGHKHILQLITKLAVSSHDKHIATAATSDLISIGNKSSLDTFLYILKSKSSINIRFTAAFGILNTPHLTREYALKAVNVFLNIITTVKPDSKDHIQIIEGSLSVTNMISSKADIHQPSWRTIVNQYRTNHPEISHSHMSSSERSKLAEEFYKKHWPPYVKKLDSWWKKHQNEIVKKLYGKKKSKKEKDKDKEHKQKQGDDSQKNQSD